MKDHRKVVVVMPAYNAARTLEATYRGLAMDIVDEVILVGGSTPPGGGVHGMSGYHAAISALRRGSGS